jgi:rifampicin phosphotransferase
MRSQCLAFPPKPLRESLGETPAAINKLLVQLSHLKVENRNKISELSGEIRGLLEGVAIPEDIHEEVARHLSRLGEKDAYTVRSRATAEDLPTASFAGQQDTYLNIIEKRAILKHVSKCWASSYTERAVADTPLRCTHHRCSESDSP